MKLKQHEILISENDIKEKVKEIGQEISRDYKGKKIMLLCVLKGAVVFLADLMRAIEIPVEIDFMAVSSYGSSTDTSGVVRIQKDLDASVEGKHILIVEDIVDTGLTLHYLIDNLQSRNPASLKVVTLLDKPERRRVELVPDYCGFKIPDNFVVGYGLDYDEQDRSLPYVSDLSPDEIEKIS